MTKMAATPIYGKDFKNLQNQKVDDLGTWFGGVGPTKFVQIMILGYLDLLNVKVKFAS